MLRHGLYWLGQDLRLHDNPVLYDAQHQLDSLTFVYIHYKSQRLEPYFNSAPSQMKQAFIHDCLVDLDHQLGAYQQHILVRNEHPLLAIDKLIHSCAITDVFWTRQFGWDEFEIWSLLQKRYPNIKFHLYESYTLYHQHQLTNVLSDFPQSYSKFVKQLAATIESPLPRPESLPPPVQQKEHNLYPSEQALIVSGGERQALKHTETYFSSSLPAHYKDVRNALMGFENSTKLSFWLSTGCLSVKQAYATIEYYEAQHTKNDSTLWIKKELLWREFFQWYAFHYQTKLFHFSGIQQHKPLTSYYASRFQMWVDGTTPYPIVNACMHELKETGYLSNRGRQIVASCFVHELQLDWRYGANYFEQQLIDYDVASNWGNWQYLAGVGADPRGHRQFNLEHQVNTYDPDGAYIQKWHGKAQCFPLDTTDAADWPQ